MALEKWRVLRERVLEGASLSAEWADSFECRNTRERGVPLMNSHHKPD